MDRRSQSAAQEAAPHGNDCTLAAHHSFGNFVVRALLPLAAIAQKLDTRSSLGTSGSADSKNELFEIMTFFGRQVEW